MTDNIEKAPIIIIQNWAITAIRRLPSGASGQREYLNTVLVEIRFADESSPWLHWIEELASTRVAAVGMMRLSGTNKYATAFVLRNWSREPDPLSCYRIAGVFVNNFCKDKARRREPRPVARIDSGKDRDKRSGRGNLAPRWFEDEIVCSEYVSTSAKEMVWKENRRLR